MMIGNMKKITLNEACTLHGSGDITHLNKPNGQHLRLNNLLQQKKGDFQ